MTALLQRRGVPAAGWSAGVMALCAAVGLAAGVSPKYALIAVLGIGFIAIVVIDLSLGIGVFAALSFLDVLRVGSTVSFDKVAGLLLLCSWLLRQATSGHAASTRDIVARHPALVTWVVAFIGWTVMSALWATGPGVPLDQAYRDVLDVLLVPITFTAVSSRRDIRVILVGFVIGAGFSAAYGLAVPSAATAAAAGRLVGSLGDANEAAAALAAGIAIAIGLAITAQRSARLRLVILVAGALALVGLLTTLSRSGLLAFGVVLIAGVAFGGRWRRRARSLLVIGVVVIPAYFLLLAPSNALQRVTSSNSSGRNDIWTVAWRMFTAHPVLGVGGNEFQYVSAQYLQRPGLITSSNYFLVTPKVAHNIYLEQLATLGVPGLITMLGIFIAGIGCLLRAAHIFERVGDRELELGARCAILALFAFLASDFFISNLHSKQLWLVFALGPAMLKLADLERQGLLR